MSARITQSDIARVAGVHNTTVSLALRNSRLIRSSTRERIQSIAKAMGYHPDPALQALIAYRSSRHARLTAENLAYITNWETKWGWCDLPTHGLHYHAARRRAGELGYQLEHLWLGEAGLSLRRLDSVLLHRGITGVLFAGSHNSDLDFGEIDWSRLSVVRIGGFPQTPAFNQLGDDPGSIVQLAMQHVLSAGYRRIGLVLSHRWDKLTGQVWSAAFHAEQYRCHLHDRLPVLRLQSPLEDQPQAVPSAHELANDAAALLHWHRQYRPDVVLGTAPCVLDHIRRSGFRAPEDFGYADLMLDAPGRGIAGVWVDCAKVGALAVELLNGQLQHNEYGIPATPTFTSVGCSWHDGNSMPLQARTGTALETVQAEHSLRI